jgi:hyperosmotically inducible periplasmic protein
VLAEVIRVMFNFGSRPFQPFAFTLLLAVAMVSAGCMRSDHPSVKLAVYNTLDQHDLRSVTVSEDRRAGVITLSGIVGANDRKQRAEQIAQQAAPGYSIVDRIQVDASGLQGEERALAQTAQLDSAIEDRYKARLASNHALKNQKIEFSAYNGTLTLKGSVKNARERKEAEDLAKRVPQVHNVVNEIEVRAGKPSPANS